MLRYHQVPNMSILFDFFDILSTILSMAPTDRFQDG